MNASPRKVENTIRSLTGSAGGLALDLSSAAARRLGLDERPAPSGGRTPIIGRFVTSPGVISDPESAIWRRFGAAEEARNGLREIIKQGDAERAREYARDHRDELLDYNRLKGAADAVGKVSDLRRAVEEHPELTRAEKREVIAKINSALARVLGGETGQLELPEMATAR